MGVPDAATQVAYDETYRRAVQRRDRFYSNNAFVKPIDPSRLTETGKAYRANQGRLNQEPSQLSDIMSRVRDKVRVSGRVQAIPFDIAKTVVMEVFAQEMARKRKTSWFTPDQEAILDDIIRYFIGDPTSPYSFQKGLFVYGDVGVGKTVLFRVMQTLCTVVPINDMTFDEVPTKTFVKAYADYRESKDKQRLDPIQKFSRGNLVLNDLGEEKQLVVSFTNQERPMDLLLSERNNAWDRYGQLTHATSNLGLGDSDEALEKQLKELYGSRILDRFFDMFEFILLPGTSKRG